MGPLPPKYTGQSLAFLSIANHLGNNNDVRVINISNSDTIIKGLFLCMKIMFYTLFYNYDVIYFTCSRSFLGTIRDIILLTCSRIKKTKVVNHLHGDNLKIFFDSQNIIYKKILVCVFSYIDTSIVLLDNMKYNFSYFPKMKIRVIANSYSKELDKLPLRKELNESTITLLYLSNIMKSKGIIYLLDAFKRLVNNDVQLIIAGDFIGDYLASEKEIRQLFYIKYNEIKKKYPNKIEYLGPIIGYKKLRLLYSTDIFILPTFHYSEAFPISIIEAMRAGNYIITTNHNFLPNIVSLKNGDLIKIESSEDIYNAIVKVLDDRERLTLVQNYNITFAQEHFSESIYTEKITTILQNINNK